jgi:hypothetical protein
MSSLQEIDAEITEYENKIALLKQKKILNYNFFKYFNISDVDRKQMTDLAIEVKYNYNDHVMDEYGHDTEAYLNVSFGDESLTIDYEEQQGCATESRYEPTVYCTINGTKGAIKLLFKNLEAADIDDYDFNEAYKELRDIIQNIVEN